MTLLVVALDALDAALVEQFDVEALLGETHGQMETVAHMRDEPYTPEAWATVATGTHPREHGVSGGTSTWTNPVIDRLANFTGSLSMSMRSRLGNLVERTTGAEYTISEVDLPHVFEGENRVVHNWPGVCNGQELTRAWDIMWREGQSTDEFVRDIRGLAAEQFGWTREMLDHPVSVAGVHVHLLDATGHAFCTDRKRLQGSYERAGRFVAELREALGPDDDLLLLSDHGMVVEWYDDELDRGQTPGNHAWRAYASSTTDSIPDSVFAVADWIDAHADPVRSDEERLDIDEEQLRDLGYI